MNNKTDPRRPPRISPVRTVPGTPAPKRPTRAEDKREQEIANFHARLATQDPFRGILGS